MPVLGSGGGDDVGVLGHEFDIPSNGTSTLGHTFSIPSPARLTQTVQPQDLDKLAEDLTVEREEPEQLLIEPISSEPTEEQPTEQQRIESSINELQEWLIAAAQMQKVMSEKLKDRRVTVDPRRNPEIRHAIRRLFGVDSSTITYEMYKQALEWRSKLLEEGRNNTYGTGS
jgi:hypothetical protein